MIYENISMLIGKTPIVNLERYREECNLFSKIFAKLECFNPGGSAKDRIALRMIKEAEANGLLREGSVIIEPTSGNTGIGLAAVGASLGYKVIIVMPDSMSMERRKLIAAYGAEIVLTPGEKGMKGAIDEAEKLAQNIPQSFIAGQFTNPENPMAHYCTTAPEIWEDMGGKIDIFVAGAGTGGTITGVGRFLKEKDPKIKIVAAEPASSPYLSKGISGPHGLQGIGAGFKPDILDMDVVDEIITVTEEEAYAHGRLLARKEGILCGITSGAALCAASTLGKKEENEGKNIVVLLPDTGERYLSTPLFQ
ncbi:MAG: cysteine synthase A [Ruminococcaceae bacterium]|nr:cysteine synthase A [Oscillospiraceae bacterium]